MVLIANDEGQKMVEHMELGPFLDEYENLTGIELTVVAASERPDFICEKRGRRFGLELVKVRRPSQRLWEDTFGGEGLLSALDAARLVQNAAYEKERKRASAGWRYPDSTILVIQLIGGDAEQLAKHLDNELMDEIGETGFREIWVADYSMMGPYGTVQLLGIKPKRWRGLHSHRYQGMKPYG